MVRITYTRCVTPKEIKMGNHLISPFSHHTWRGVGVPHFFCFYCSASNFFAAYDTFLCALNITKAFRSIHDNCIALEIYTVCSDSIQRYNNSSFMHDGQNSSNSQSVTQWLKREDSPLLPYWIQKIWKYGSNCTSVLRSLCWCMRRNSYATWPRIHHWISHGRMNNQYGPLIYTLQTPIPSVTF